MTTIAAQSLLRQPARASLEDLSAPPILSMGFRPFFLLAALVAVFWVPLWLLLLSGSPDAVRVANESRLPVAALHAHEMIFGFATAVIAGFLLTAGANWTGRPTTSGKSLALLAALFVAGRVCMLTNVLPPLYTALVDIAFLPALGLTLLVPLVRSQSKRNFQFVLMLAILTIANALMHAATFAEFVTLTGLTPRAGETLALRVITLMILVMGGRVIPLFTRNATGQHDIKERPFVDRFALAVFILAALTDLLTNATQIAGVLFLVAGASHLVRMRGWGSRHATAPLLWILHAGYGAVAVSLLFEGLSAWGFLAQTVALHLLTVGGIGGLCLGMMTRVSLGHSGRMLSAPRTMSVAFHLLMGATLVRVGGPVLFPSSASESYQLSGALWTAAFALLLHFGAPIWFSPRVDQKAKE